MSTFDYQNLADELIQIVKQATNLLLIESNSSGKQPDYPFWTYTITSPHLATTADVINHEIFEMVISLSVHCQSKLEGLGYSEVLSKYFKSFACRDYLSAKSIVVVGTSNVTQRDTLISIEYERVVGFDLRLRVQDDYVDDVPLMANVKANVTNEN